MYICKYVNVDIERAELLHSKYEINVWNKDGRNELKNLLTRKLWSDDNGTEITLTNTSCKLE